MPFTKTKDRLRQFYRISAACISFEIRLSLTVPYHFDGLPCLDLMYCCLRLSDNGCYSDLGSAHLHDVTRGETRLFFASKYE